MYLYPWPHSPQPNILDKPQNVIASMVTVHNDVLIYSFQKENYAISASASLDFMSFGGRKKKKNCLLLLWLKMQVCTSPVSLELGMSRVLHSVDNTLAPDFEIEDQYTKEAGNMKNSPCCSGFCSKVKLGAHAWNIQCPKPLISTV